MRIIIFISSIILLIVGILVISLKGHEKTDTVICKKCGHEFKYDNKNVVDYKYSGKLRRSAECPVCKTYTEI